MDAYASSSLLPTILLGLSTLGLLTTPFFPCFKSHPFNSATPSHIPLLPSPSTPPPPPLPPSGPARGGCFALPGGGPCRRTWRRGAVAAGRHPRLEHPSFAASHVPHPPQLIFLALADPTRDKEEEYQQVANFGCLVVFTVESGPAQRPGDPYSTIAGTHHVVVVIEGWVSYLSSGSGHLSGLKTRGFSGRCVANPCLQEAIISACLGRCR